MNSNKHVLTNGTGSQILVELNPEFFLISYNGALRVVATRNEIKKLVSDLLTWAAWAGSAPSITTPTPTAETTPTPTAETTPTPTAETTPTSTAETTPTPEEAARRVTETADALRYLLSTLIEEKPSWIEIKKALYSIPKPMRDEALQAIMSRLPDEFKIFGDVFKSL